MKLYKYFVTIFLIAFSISAFSQKSVKKREKVIAKQKEAKKKASEQASDEGRKRHLNIQTRKTKKRMKKNAKRSKGMRRKSN